MTGYGIITKEGRDYHFIECGTLKLGDGSIPDRLQKIFAGLTEVIKQFEPHEVAIEQVFMGRNADSALKLGQARGAAICAATALGLPVAEYSARQIKQAVVGTGAADKSQVQHMVGMLLNLKQPLQADAADALAVSLCHMQVKQVQSKIPQVKGSVRGRWR